MLFCRNSGCGPRALGLYVFSCFYLESGSVTCLAIPQQILFPRTGLSWNLDRRSYFLRGVEEGFDLTILTKRVPDPI